MTAPASSGRRTRSRARAPEPRTAVEAFPEFTPNAIDNATVVRQADGSIDITLGNGGVSSVNRLSAGLARALGLKLERITRS